MLPVRRLLCVELTASHIDLRRVENDAAVDNSPLWFGEWALSTQFDASDDFLRDWADAQKLAYSKGQGWIVRRFSLRGCVVMDHSSL